jgi:hypothetical protein
VEGLLLARAGDIQAAIKRLERARFSYTIANPQLDQAVRCSLELARLYCSREQFQAAYHHLQTEVEPLLTKGVVTDPALCARFYLRMAELTPDIGLLPATATYARQALKHYRTVGDRTGELRALLRLLLPLRHQGEFAEAVTLLTLAQGCLSDGKVTDLDRARVLNAEIHFHWYRGQLATALPLAEAYVALADRVPTSNFRVYARMLLGRYHSTKWWRIKDEFSGVCQGVLGVQKAAVGSERITIREQTSNDRSARWPWPAFVVANGGDGVGQSWVGAGNDGKYRSYKWSPRETWLYAKSPDVWPHGDCAESGSPGVRERLR